MVKTYLEVTFAQSITKTCDYFKDRFAFDSVNELGTWVGRIIHHGALYTQLIFLLLAGAWPSGSRTIPPAELFQNKLEWKQRRVKTRVRRCKQRSNDDADGAVTFLSGGNVRMPALWWNCTYLLTNQGLLWHTQLADEIIWSDWLIVWGWSGVRLWRTPHTVSVALNHRSRAIDVNLSICQSRGSNESNP